MQGLKAKKARLDTNKNEKPLTVLKAVHRAGECVLPGIGAEEYIIEEENVFASPSEQTCADSNDCE